MIYQSLEQAAIQLRQGTLSAVELCKMCLQQAKRVEKLNAVVCLMEDAALAAAESSDIRLRSRKNIRPLEGIPIVVKDNFCTKGVRTTCASKMLLDFVPPYNATVVERLEAAGAYCIGKTNLDEFAMGSGTVDSVFGPTHNIWGSGLDATNCSGPRVPGGSSGGSAVAVATAIAFGGLGSDSGGSTRNPGSYCGVIGYKPTYSSVSRYGLIPLVNSMDVPGLLTRSVTDAALLYNEICGLDEKDSTTVSDAKKIHLAEQPSVSGLRVGIPVEYHCEGMSPEMVAAWSNTAAMLADAGASLKPVSMKMTELSLAVYSVLNQCEVASNMARYDGVEYGLRVDGSSTNEMLSRTRSAGLSVAVRGRILAGNYFLLSKNYEKYFLKAEKVRRLICEEFAATWRECDVLLTPTTPTQALTVQEFTSLDNREQCSKHDYCTQPANLSGCPAISVPVELSAEGLPLSVQLMAPNFHDEALLSVAKWIETAVSFPGPPRLRDASLPGG